MSLATAEIGCTVSPPLSGAMEDCSIVRGPQLQRRCCQNCCMSGQRRMFGSLWSVVVVHEHQRHVMCHTHAYTGYATYINLLCNKNWKKHSATNIRSHVHMYLHLTYAALCNSLISVLNTGCGKSIKIIRVCTTKQQKFKTIKTEILNKTTKTWCNNQHFRLFWNIVI